MAPLCHPGILLPKGVLWWLNCSFSTKQTQCTGVSGLCVQGLVEAPRPLSSHMGCEIHLWPEAVQTAQEHGVGVPSGYTSPVARNLVFVSPLPVLLEGREP